MSWRVRRLVASSQALVQLEEQRAEVIQRHNDAHAMQGAAPPSDAVHAPGPDDRRLADARLRRDLAVIDQAIAIQLKIYTKAHASARVLGFGKAPEFPNELVGTPAAAAVVAPSTPPPAAAPAPASPAAPTATPRPDDFQLTEKQIADATRTWLNSVREQLSVMALAAVALFILVLLASSTWSLPDMFLPGDDRGEFTSVGNMDVSTSLTAVTGLSALVGAVAVALIVAPRVEHEAAPTDMVALARWGRYATGLNGVAAGAALGIAAGQLVESRVSPASVVMVTIAVMASALAAVSVQRRRDQYLGGLAAAERRRLERALRALSSASPDRSASGADTGAGNPSDGRSADSGKEPLDTSQALEFRALLLATLKPTVPIVGYALVATAAAAIHDYFDGAELTAWSYAGDAAFLFFMTLLVAGVTAWPYYGTLTSRVRRRALEQKWHRYRWARAPLGGATLLGLAALIMSGVANSFFLLVALGGVAAPTLMAIVLLLLAARNKGPWGSVTSAVRRQLYYELKVAADRDDALRRAAALD